MKDTMKWVRLGLITALAFALSGCGQSAPNDYSTARVAALLEAQSEKGIQQIDEDLIAQDFIYDGTQSTFSSNMRDEVTKQEWVDVPYQDTCVRTVPDGYDNVCETRYRNEQQCGNERVCHQEQQCHLEHKCWQERQCETKQVCTTRQECSVHQVCQNEQRCEIVNGRRVCHIERVCHQERECHPVKDCHPEQVCQVRPVCRDDKVCGPVQICRDEYRCRIVTVPYQECHQVPRYRDEYYACTKTRRELRTVLDYRHTLNVVVNFENVNIPLGLKDQFRVITQDGRVELQIVNQQSGLVYYHKMDLQTQSVGPQDRLTTGVITIRAMDSLGTQAAESSPVSWQPFAPFKLTAPVNASTKSTIVTGFGH